MSVLYRYLWPPGQNEGMVTIVLAPGEEAALDRIRVDEARAAEEAETTPAPLEGGRLERVNTFLLHFNPAKTATDDYLWSHCGEDVATCSDDGALPSSLAAARFDPDLHHDLHELEGEPFGFLDDGEEDSEPPRTLH